MSTFRSPVNGLLVDMAAQTVPNPNCMRNLCPVRETPTPPPEPLAISGAAPTGTVGVAYSYTPTTEGGTAPYSYALTGTLPDGLTFDTNTGEISGTPTTAAGATPITITVTDADTNTAQLETSITINE